jgi:hypothetical protein
LRAAIPELTHSVQSNRLPPTKRLSIRSDVRSVLLRALAVVCALHVSGAHWLVLADSGVDRDDSLYDRKLQASAKPCARHLMVNTRAAFVLR